ncbi:hypothetical protein L596_025450 [Steinernema carpocapsae]|uniref:Uncharacterized protein n=1 Tax=Steinernema carpocapsae TaxID=34508 RepID=A0A4V5ZYT3_STECR|nr:hypothetical protein L596_025450 [Steinernema carpocapsae]
MARIQLHPGHMSMSNRSDRGSYGEGTVCHQMGHCPLNAINKTFILHGAKLFHQFLVDSYVSMEQKRL